MECCQNSIVKLIDGVLTCINCGCDGVAKLPRPSTSAQMRFAPSTKLYDLFYLKTKQCCGASRKQFSKQYDTIFNMFQCVDTYKLTNDVGRTSKGKYQIIKFSTKVDKVQRDKNTAAKTNLKPLFKCEVTASSSQRTH